MKVSISWLKELVDLPAGRQGLNPIDELVALLPLRTIGTKEVTSEFIELDMKGYNRADLLSLRGVAFEVAAITDSSLKFEDEEVTKTDLLKKYAGLKETDLEVEDKDLAPLYCLIKIENLKVEDSNESWKQKLQSSGIRPVNNVADVTNLVMLEYGQPMHSFDADKIDSGKIIVKRAKSGEEIKTLDGKLRKLEASDLLITDPKKPVGIAGVMGGENSEITNSTNTILLEAAIFDPKNLRKTANRLGLQSEASKRFYHGLTQRRLFQALDKAIKYYEELDGKVTEISLAGEYPETIKKINLSAEKVRALIGVDIKDEKIEEYLSKLYFTVIPAKAGIKEMKKAWIPDQVRDDKSIAWQVTVPYFRLDVEIEEDLIEEVARMYGYEKLPSTPLPGDKPEEIDQNLFNLIHNIKQELVKIGLTEVQTYPYFSTLVLNNLGWKENLEKLIKIANPISAETQYLRQNIWSNLLEVASNNLKRGFKEIAIFEVGKSYSPSKGRPEEPYQLSVLVTNGSNNPLAEIYKIAEILKEKLDLKIEFKEENTPSIVKEIFHPNRFLGIMEKGEMIGGMAEIHPRIVNKFGVEQRVAVLEIAVQKFINL